MANPIAERFVDFIIARVDADAKKWIRENALKSVNPFNQNTFTVAFAKAGRIVGTEVFDPTSDELASFEELGMPQASAIWTLDEGLRMGLTGLAIDALEEDKHVPMIYDLYYRGDSKERRAVLKALVLLPDPARFLTVGFDATRNHDQTVFEGIACENPYPAKYFPELNFNQMVLKALFTGASLERIDGWKDRLNDELVRMSTDYANERKAAGREVPVDIQKIIDEARSRS